MPMHVLIMLHRAHWADAYDVQVILMMHLASCWADANVIGNTDNERVKVGI